MILYKRSRVVKEGFVTGTWRTTCTNITGETTCAVTSASCKTACGGAGTCTGSAPSTRTTSISNCQDAENNDGNIRCLTNCATSCSAGYYASGTSCSYCTAGNYCTGGTAAQAPCGTGRTSSAGATSSSSCTCSSGTYGTNGLGTCTACPTYATCSGGTTFTCTYPRTNNGSACVCPTNTYGTNCTACPTYATCSGGTTFTCPAGFTNNGTACVCPQGLQPNSAGTACVCGAGTYGTTTCATCPPNSTCASGGTLSGTSGQTTFRCAAGFSNTGTACESCPPGYACAGDSTSALASVNTPCAQGKYSPGGLSVCSNCPINTYNTLTGQSNCTACPSNSTCYPGGGCNATGLTSIVCEETRGYSFPDGSTTRCEKTRFGSNLPYYTQGTLEQMYNTMPYSNADGQINRVGCHTTEPRTCLYNWKTSPTTSFIGFASNNPCPARNSWYDFAKEKCVDGLGNEVLTMNPCASNTVYSLRDNACVQVRVPFAQQPPNTIGLPSLTDPGDFSNCKTTDQGDCTPYYKKIDGTGTQATNPCAPGTQYDFKIRACTINSNVANSNACCGKPATDLATNASCSNYVQASQIYTKNPTMCPTGATDRCCSVANQKLALCASYWTKTPSYSYKPSYNTLCGIAGFEDYDNSINTMADKRLQWLQRRQLINA